MKKIMMILTLTAIFAACSPYTLINSQVYDNVDMSSYKTFNFFPAKEDTRMPGVSVYDMQMIQKAIANEMIKRGYTQSDKPELMINLAIFAKAVVETKDALPYDGAFVRPVYYGRGFGYVGYYSDAQVVTDIHQEGSLSMDIVDVKKNERVYNAVMSTNIQPDMPNLKKPEKLAEATEFLFKKYPVKPLAVETK